MGKVIRDVDMMVTAGVFYLTLPVVIYGIIFISDRMTLFLIPLVIFILVLAYLSARSYHRFAKYEISGDLISMRYGTFLFFRNLEIHPDDIMAIYEVDPYRWSWMRGADERLPIYFLFRNGRKWIQIKHPPKGLAESISEECDVELIRSSRARFIHDFIDLRHS